MSQSPNRATALDVFLHDCCAEIERRAAVAEPLPGVLCHGAAAFRNAIDSARPADAPLTVVPALAEVDNIPRAVLGPAVAQVPWVPTPRLGDDGAQVALGLVDQVRELGEVQCGLMLLGAGAAYPEHSHPPQEIYLPIADGGSWRFGGSSEYRMLGEDELVYNHPGDRHGAIAGHLPLLALYILWP